MSIHFSVPEGGRYAAVISYSRGIGMTQGYFGFVPSFCELCRRVKKEDMFYQTIVMK
jgi:hypothetical protein